MLLKNTISVLSGLIMLISIESCLSQETADEVNIAKSKEIIKSFFNENINDYMLYIIRDKYIVIVKTPTNYVVSFISEDNGLEHKTTYEINNLDLNALFESSSYSKKSVLSGLNYKNDCPLTYIYWVVYKQGAKIVEFNLPSMLMCSDNKVNYPVNDKLMTLLFNMVRDQWYE